MRYFKLFILFIGTGTSACIAQASERLDFQCNSTSEYSYSSTYKNSPVEEHFVDLKGSDKAKEKSSFTIRMYDSRAVFEGYANGEIIPSYAFYHPHITSVRKSENKYFGGNISFGTVNKETQHRKSHFSVETGTLQSISPRGNSVFTLRYNVDNAKAYAAYNTVSSDLDIRTILWNAIFHMKNGQV